MAKTKKERRMNNVTMLGDFGTKELRQHGTVVLENAHEGRAVQIKRARVLTAIEFLRNKGLLHDTRDPDHNDAAYAAAVQFFHLWHRHCNLIGITPARSLLAERVSGSKFRALIEGERDAYIEREYRDLAARMTHKQFAALVDVACEGWFPNEVAGNSSRPVKRLMDDLRDAIAVCVSYWA